MQQQTGFLRKLADLRTDAAQELERIQGELRELDVLIRQSTAEVERLAQRNLQAQNRVRQMEMNFDTVPREDIKALYTAAHEMQMRLFMMRSQIEQLQNKQRILEQYAEMLQRVVEFADTVESVPGTSALRLSDEEGEFVPLDSMAMVAQLIEAQESERLNLARQMHDGPAQSLTNLILQAEVCQRLFDMDADRARVELNNLKNAVNTTFQQIRDFIFDLRPMMLDDLGLVPTVKRYVEALQKKVPFAIRLQVFGDEQRFDPTIEITLFRTLQELLRNVERHANASNVLVTLDRQGDEVILTVEDDGVGFDVGSVLRTSAQQKRIGLTTLQERIEMLQGKMQVDSAAGRGTRVQVRMPALAPTEHTSPRLPSAS